jgi:hypothetical protein
MSIFCISFGRENNKRDEKQRTEGLTRTTFQSGTVKNDLYVTVFSPRLFDVFKATTIVPFKVVLLGSTHVTRMAKVMGVGSIVSEVVPGVEACGVVRTARIPIIFEISSGWLLPWIIATAVLVV